MARAATAADFYFPKWREEGGRYSFSDIGNGINNNPSWLARNEIGSLKGLENIENFVSVGTARGAPEGRRRFWNTIPRTAKEMAHDRSNPEHAHELMESHSNLKEGSYVRLNALDALKMPLDDCRPRQRRWIARSQAAGTTTFKEIHDAFTAWIGQPRRPGADTPSKQIENLAEKLVQDRRARMETSQWERYAVGATYTCKSRGCGEELHTQPAVRAHLAEKHDISGDIGADEIGRHCVRSVWRYQCQRQQR